MDNSNYFERIRILTEARDRREEEHKEAMAAMEKGMEDGSQLRHEGQGQIVTPRATREQKQQHFLDYFWPKFCTDPAKLVLAPIDETAVRVKAAISWGRFYITDLELDVVLEEVMGKYVGERKL